MSVERAKYGALGRRRRLWMVDAVDKEGQADDVAKEDEFLRYCINGATDALQTSTYLSHVCTDLSNLRKELYACHPFCCA